MRIIIHMGTLFATSDSAYLDNTPNSRRMQTFAKVFLAEGHSVCVIAPRDKHVKPVVRDGIKYISCRCYNPKKTNSMKRLWSQVSFAFRSVFASFRAGKADVVLTTSPPALLSPAGWLIAKLKRAKLVYDVRDIWPDVALEMGSFKEGSLYEKGFRWVRDFMLKKADLTTAVSPGKVKKLSSYPHKNDVMLISNGFDLDFLLNKEDEEVAKKYQLDPKRDCVYVGKIGLAQGLNQLMLIAKQAQHEGMDTRFLLFGIGVEKEELQKYVETSGLKNVFFCDAIPNKQIYTVLKRVKMCFVSLVNEKLTDSVPTKLYEALGVGCPVLLAACGDAADVLNKAGLGIAVTPNDHEALWNAFCTLYKKDYSEKEIYAAEKLMITAYSRQASAERMEIAISGLLKNEGAK